MTLCGLLVPNKRETAKQWATMAMGLLGVLTRSLRGEPEISKNDLHRQNGASEDDTQLAHVQSWC